MHFTQFTERNGDRSGVPNVAVIITDGVSTYDKNRTIPDAEAARDDGIIVRLSCFICDHKTNEKK